ncbi:C40 family peptidase [Zophobihabitans entericus]|nr:NlpC/P60 family protein [Zophobihabitans entericus]
MLSVLLISGCANQEAAYQDQYSDSTVINKLESQYLVWKNTPYRYGGMTVKGSDCSGLVMNTFKTHFATQLPRTTAQQAKIGDKVDELVAGDLVFFKTGRGENGLHVGIYYKDGMFLHVSTSRGVEFASLEGGYWKNNYWMSRRVI